MRPDHLESGTAPLVHLVDGFVAIAPAVLPGSTARFYRGRPPAVGGVPLHTTSPAVGCSGSGRELLAPDVPAREGTTQSGAAGASVPAAPTRGRRPCAT
jgi:hypothetical protein